MDQAEYQSLKKELKVTTGADDIETLAYNARRRFKSVYISTFILGILCIVGVIPMALFRLGFEFFTIGVVALCSSYYYKRKTTKFVDHLYADPDFKNE